MGAQIKVHSNNYAISSGVAGSNSQVQYNDEGVLAGADFLFYNKHDRSLRIGNTLFFHYSRITDNSISNYAHVTQSSNRGTLNLGPGGFSGNIADGAFFGNTHGTSLAMNMNLGYTGDLVNLMVYGLSKFKIEASGKLIVNGDLVCTADIQAGTTNYFSWQGRAKMFAPETGVITMYNYTKTGFNRLNFGGDTSNQTSLKANGTTLECRLADDSALTVFEASAFIANGSAGASAPSGVYTTFTVVGGIITAIS